MTTWETGRREGSQQQAKPAAATWSEREPGRQTDDTCRVPAPSCGISTDRRSNVTPPRRPPSTRRDGRRDGAARPAAAPAAAAVSATSHHVADRAAPARSLLGSPSANGAPVWHAGYQAPRSNRLPKVRTPVNCIGSSRENPHASQRLAPSPPSHTPLTPSHPVHPFHHSQCRSGLTRKSQMPSHEEQMSARQGEAAMPVVSGGRAHCQ